MYHQFFRCSQEHKGEPCANQGWTRRCNLTHSFMNGILLTSCCHCPLLDGKAVFKMGKSEDLPGM